MTIYSSSFILPSYTYCSFEALDAHSINATSNCTRDDETIKPPHVRWIANKDSIARYYRLFPAPHHPALSRGTSNLFPSTIPNSAEYNSYRLYIDLSLMNRRQIERQKGVSVRTKFSVVIRVHF